MIRILFCFLCTSNKTCPDYHGFLCVLYKDTCMNPQHILMSPCPDILLFEDLCVKVMLYLCPWFLCSGISYSWVLECLCFFVFFFVGVYICNFVLKFYTGTKSYHRDPVYYILGNFHFIVSVSCRVCLRYSCICYIAWDILST